MIMAALGKGTHAIIGGEVMKIFGKTFGHAWNYVYNQDKDIANFVLLDGYSKRHFQKGLNHPEEYFRDYYPIFNEVVLFYDNTEKNAEILKELL